MPDFRNINLHAIARQAMGRYGFLPQFPKEVLDEVSGFGAGVFLKDNSLPDVRDLRALLWSSIDNAESLDLDQLEYCEAANDGRVTVKIAIADVDLYVAKNSRIDRHAAVNGTSVYTGVETFPMLPQRLSTDLTSLKAAQDRRAVVIEFTVLPDGSVGRSDVYRALVNNKAKLVYDEIGYWLEGKSTLPASVASVPGLEPQLRLQDEASLRLRKFRLDQGALELGTIEAMPVMKEETILDLVVPSDNRARHLIEDFMISANGTMVSFLESKNVPIIQRIVRTPRNWQGIVDLAQAVHETLPLQPDQKALSKFILRRKEADLDHFPDLSLAIVKLLGPGEYITLEPGQTSSGHFGLAVMDYTHATAPNRRYVDVIIQRLLKSILESRECPYTLEELAAIAARCTDRDQSAKKVERFMRKAAAAVFMSGRIGQAFDAIVTGASDKGTYVRLIAPPVEGRVMRGQQGLAVGQKVRVRLISMDPYQGFIDFERT
jgi:VacB/RNase II family 3'-5' exoribonuclease